MKYDEFYEANLKLYYESKRKDLDILLTSTIPTQKNLMKTILWLNSSILALSITALSKNVGVIFISIPFVFSFLAILKILISLKDGREKTFGCFSLSHINELYSNENAKIQALYDMNNSLDIAFKNNSKLVKKRAERIASATTYSIISISSIFIMVIIYVNIYLMKGG